MHIDNQAAPGDLEQVRRLINTWSIPNQTRIAIDALPRLTSDAQAWAHELSAHPRHTTDTLDALIGLRLALRQACAQQGDAAEVLNGLLKQTSLQAHVESIDGLLHLHLRASQHTYTDYILAIVTNAIASGEWSRIKTCGDCQWAFYDHTRNGSKRWCGMTKGGPEGRACGTIAKVSAFRLRAAGKVQRTEQ